MRNIEFYKQKLQNSETLSEVEKHLSSGLKQIENDQLSLKKKRQKHLRSIKEIEERLRSTKGIKKWFVSSSQKKTSEILLQYNING